MSEYFQTVFDKFEFRVRKEYRYIESDLWVHVLDGKARIGVTDYLQRTSGDVAFIEVAKPSATIEKGREFGTIESAKTTVALLSPVSGKVEETNSKLADKPELVNLDPYGDGWLVVAIPSDPADASRSLLSAEDYYKLMLEKLQSEHNKLESR